MTTERVSATLRMSVPAASVFAVVADPSTHASVDGTGWVSGAVDATPLTERGQQFRMAMYHPDHPDGGYETVNEVIVVDPPSAIAWRTGFVNDAGDLEFAGWWWRYDLAPVGADQVDVTLSYDWSEVGPGPREYLDFPVFADGHLERSLEHLADLSVAQRPLGP